jgi:hypothetical protein
LGTEPATGPTQIRGNYLGLGADGLATVGENEYGVFAAPGLGGCLPGPGEVTVGGTSPTESNYFDGGRTAIFAESAENFTASGNAIGFAADGTESEPPSQVGISVCTKELSEEAHVSGNRLALGFNEIGIESTYGRAQITGNSIQGSEMGIVTGEESENHGDRIQGNTVTEPDLYGIQIHNQSNVVIGNSITNSGRAGIELEEADHNQVGGDLPAEENVIVGAGRGAIVISGIEEQRNEVAGNHGSGNAEAFIQLLAQSGGEHLNGGIEPPLIATALQSSATGTAAPGARVRIFSKTTIGVGELGPLLAVAEADAVTGRWKATYATVPAGTLIAATATSDAGTAAGGTSEVSAPLAATADPFTPPVVPAASPPVIPPPTPVPATPKAPTVKIAKGPAKSSTATTAKFKFTASPAAGAKFECKLDGKKWAKCKSPVTYKKLKPGRHTFQVRASVAGSPASKPAKYIFTVKA